MREHRLLVGSADASEAPQRLRAPRRPSDLPHVSRMTARRVQITLGVLWLLDGLLQFQSFMYTHAFVRDVLAVNASGQPGPLATSINALAGFYGRDLPLWNTLVAELQCAIGLGLIVSPRSVRPALAASILWCLVVWLVGEGLGGILTSAPLSPLMGAPGAALIYGLVGLLVWPSRERGAAARAGDLIWAGLWLEGAVLWLTGAQGSPSAQLQAMAASAPAPLAGFDRALAAALHGAGGTAAPALAALSVLIGLGALTRRRRMALLAGSLLALTYWVFGQSLGGPFWAGASTDVNTGPLFVLLAAYLFVPLPLPQSLAAGARGRGLGGATVASRRWRARPSPPDETGTRLG